MAVIAVLEASRSFKRKQAGSGSRVGFAMARWYPSIHSSSDMREEYQHMIEGARDDAKWLTF